jgi:hypothetical protein
MIASLRLIQAEMISPTSSQGLSYSSFLSLRHDIR